MLYSTETSQAVVAARMPCGVKVTGGKRYAWCACGHSKKQAQLSTLPSEPVIASKKPLKVDLVGGKRYSWCTCGHSKKQPFCDGAHKTKAEGLVPLRFVPEQDSTAWLCGCKYTNNPPYCDGTHKQDFIKSAQIPEQTNS
ncbi:CDGSH iron-sulfur domain-containing protein 3, mitochondrial-like isoform X2 [Hypomesus transpacificus]|nr:CDGSH iron-sulfur domain-containing protein 3, mitochondrial-like isoform X2 [Hypomesus transpacificus]XP_046900046.1 CDGSH iron-sulfur domain-containing protein 3, mitochondrial-like isoform X2 [Hypomesus transpacificus]XP_046900047.1 CDGSH iron-sulfur domain-containing protein 3, mitochondrial-like isoform X2 [Hypomesus transpacificus]